MPKRLKKVGPDTHVILPGNPQQYAIAEALREIEAGPKPAPRPPRRQTAAEIISAHMAKLGAKGGKVSGAKRMEMPEKQRKAIAKKAAEARWGKKANKR